jgi:WD40 repeat protein
VKYNAFISYSHAGDREFAPTLHSTIEKLGKPWYRRRATRAFLDQTDLAANPGAWTKILAALQNSEFFILLATPKAIDSKWVAKELDYWLTTRPVENLLIGLTDGAIYWDDNTKDFDWKCTTALPPQLSRRFTNEPLWADFRQFTSKNVRSARNEFLKAAAKLAAPLNNTSPGELVNEDLRQHRKALRLAKAALMLLVSLMLGLIGAVLIATRQRDIALSRQLAAQSDLLRAQSNAVETRVLLAIESMRLVPGIENDLALRESLYLLRKPLFIAKQKDEITAWALSCSGLAAIASHDGTIRILDSKTGAEVRHWFEGGKVVALAFGSDGHSIAMGALEGESRLIDVSNGKVLGQVAHQNGTYMAAVSNSGRWLATVSQNGPVRVFDIATGTEVRHVAQTHRLSVLTFSPDDEWIGLGTDDGIVQIFQRSGTKTISHVAHKARIEAIAFSPSSRLVATGCSDGTSRVFDTAEFKELPRPSPSGWRERLPSTGGEPFSVLSIVRTVIFSPDSHFLATGNGDSTARIFEIATGKELLRLQHDNLVEAVAFSPDARWIGTGSRDSTARIFETSSGREIAHLKEEDPVRGIAFTPDGQQLITLTDKSLRAFEAYDGRELTRLLQQNLLTTAVFSADGQKLAVKSFDGRHIQILDMTRRTVVSKLPRKDLEAALTLQQVDFHKFKPNGKRLLYSGEGVPVDFSSDSEKVAIVDDDGTRVLEAISGKELARVPGKEVKAVAFSPDDQWIATANADGTAQVFSSSTGTIAFSTKIKEGLGAMLFSPNSKLVATAGGDHSVYVFEVPSGRVAARLIHQTAVETLAFTADSRRLATGASDGTARVFWISSGEEVLHVAGQARVTAIAFSPDDRWIGIGSDDRTARVLEATTGTQVALITNQSPVFSVVFSPDSSSVATTSYDYSVRVFEAATGRELSRIILDGRLKAMRFVEAGRVLETASSGRLESEEAVSAKSDFISVQRHLLRAEDLIQEGCSRLTRNLTEEETRQYLNGGRYHRTCPQLLPSLSVASQ